MKLSRRLNMVKSTQNNFLFVLPTAVLGGAERTMFNLITKLLKDENNVTLYIMSRGKQEGWESLENNPNFKMINKNYKSEKTSLPTFFLSISILSHFNSYDYTLSSHTHVNGTLSLMRKLKFLKTKKLISRESTFIFDRFQGFPRELFKFIYRFMYGSQDLVICQTEKMKYSLISSLGFNPAKNIQVVPNPVNLDYVSQQLEASEHSYKPFDKVIVGCGRFIPLKQFDILIKAFKSISVEFPDVGLMIIGDGPERKNIENLISQLDLGNRVILTGKIKNPIQWFNTADIGVISSSIEGFPNVLLEMMASGTKHIITTPCTDGVNYIPYITVANSTSKNSIEEALRLYLANPVDNAVNNQKYIRDNRSVDIFWDKVQRLL